MSCSMDSWSGGMSTTTKVVLAVLLGVALVFLFAWLLCPCPSDRRDCYDRRDCHDRRYRDNCGWSGSSGDDCCDDDMHCVVVTPSPACAPSPCGTKRYYKDDCGWSGSTSDNCGWSGSFGNNACRSPRRRRC